MALNYEVACVVKVAVLGATGMVGQRFVELLEGHPSLELVCLAASDASKGKAYSEACSWILDSEMPNYSKHLRLVGCNAKEVAASGATLVFSALPAGVASGVEEDMAKAGLAVVSKASPHRMEADVPLIIPEVNPEHLSLIGVQRKKRGWKGFISTDPNCSTCQLAIALKPLQQFGIRSVYVVTMQALSGAGYPGVPSLAIENNAIPFIEGEEEKIESELLKLLGPISSTSLIPASFGVMASCNRINSIEGHLESVFVEFERKVSVAEARTALAGFLGEPQLLKLHSAPRRPIVVREEADRPQPRRDWREGNGMSVVVGRLREGKGNTLIFSCLSSNTVRGAAGNGILHAELLHAKGLV